MRLLNLSLILAVAAIYTGCTSTGVREVASIPGKVQARTYCGWVDNPTPANLEMEDSQGSLTISVQGGHQADGDLNVETQYFTNGVHGTGCGCMTAELSVGGDERVVDKILSSKQLPLSQCQKDKSIKSSMRPNILVHSSGKAYTECQGKDEMEIKFNEANGGRKACVNEGNEYYYLAD